MDADGVPGSRDQPLTVMEATVADVFTDVVSRYPIGAGVACAVATVHPRRLFPNGSTLTARP
jgi:hypothetical protein